jgi:hypothetical protein
MDNNENDPPARHGGQADGSLMQLGGYFFML